MNVPKRRFSERAGLVPAVTTTVIGAGTVFVGQVRGKGQFVVFGTIHGDGRIDGALHLSASALWFGLVEAQQAVVAGKITGGLVVTGKLEIGHSAVIRGRVSARTIAIAKGAIVDGEVEITSGTPVVEFVAKREDD